MSKRLTRRFERQFLREPSNIVRTDLWHSQVRIQRRLFQYKRSSYLWRSIEDATGYGRTLWRSLQSHFQPPAADTSAITPDGLLEYLDQKIGTIRDATKDASLPIFTDMRCQSGLVSFIQVIRAEVEQLINAFMPKQCQLDSVLTQILKTICSSFAPILTFLVNASLFQSHLPCSHKRAIIRPLLKKPCLDLSDPASYRPIDRKSVV